MEPKEQLFHVHDKLTPKIVAINGNGTTNGATKDYTSSNEDVVLNLDIGDPTMFYPYWKKMDNESSITIKASDHISYFVNHKEPDFFFQMPEFIDAVRRVHQVVGNAVTEDRYIIGGTGASQLFIAAVRVLASTIKETTSSNKKRVPVVCAEPYYSFYKDAIELEKSEMYEWQGDANTFEAETGAYIEIVTSPNNPDGRSRKPVVKREGGAVIYDLAYYWPHYTPITSPADFDVMLFTLSKATGHAGSRVGWAIVRDEEIAKKMKKHILLMSIGSCQEGQVRATKILNFVADIYEHDMHELRSKVPKLVGDERLFEYGHRVLAERWEKLRDVVQRSGVISLLDFSPAFCNFKRKLTSPTPAFAWVESKTDEEDTEELKRILKIQARNGSRFGEGISGRYIRVSMMGDDRTFNLFLQRLSSPTIIMPSSLSL